jgi:hypothetical protein
MGISRARATGPPLVGFSGRAREAHAEIAELKAETERLRHAKPDDTDHASHRRIADLETEIESRRSHEAELEARLKFADDTDHAAQLRIADLERQLAGKPVAYAVPKDPWHDAVADWLFEHRDEWRWASRVLLEKVCGLSRTMSTTDSEAARRLGRIMATSPVGMRVTTCRIMGAECGDIAGQGTRCLLPELF